MKKYSKIGALLLVAVLSISQFVACGGNDNSSEPTTKTEAVKEDKKSNDKVAEKEEPIVIDWMPQNDQPVDENSEVVKKLEEQFNCEFNFIYLDRNKERELLNVRIASGEIPDVMRVNDDIYRQYISQGVLADIPEDMVKEVAPTLYDQTLENGGKYAWEYPKEGDILYGLPYLNADGKYHFVNIWREDWLKNVGINSIPETLEEAEEAFYKFANNDPDGNGQKDTYALSDKGMSSIFGAFGGVPYTSKGGGSTYTWTAKDGEVVLTATMPEMKEALTLLNKWYKDGLVDPEFITGENKGQYWGKSVTFWNGKIGFSTPGKHYHVAPPLHEGEAGSTNYQGYVELNGTDNLFAVGKPIVGPEGAFGAESWGTFPGIYVVLGKQVADDEAKMKKILEINEALVSDFDTYILAKFGLEGKHYAQKDGVYSYLSELTKEITAKTGLNTNGINYLGSNNFDFTKNTTGRKYEYAEEISLYSDNYKNAVWAGLPSDIQYKATVYKKVLENYFLFITGERDLDEFDTFVEELNKAGLEQLTKEANDWYNRYNR